MNVWRQKTTSQYEWDLLRYDDEYGFDDRAKQVGPWTIEREISEGMQGVVYLAFREETGEKA